MPEDLFLKNKFLHLPTQTNWKLLRNITIDMSSNGVKLYFYNSSQDFFIKYDANKSFKQFIANRNGIDYYPLSKFLGHKFNLDDIIVDTVELNNGIYFLSISETNPNHYTNLLEYLLKRYV